MIQKPFDAIDKVDIKALIENQVREGRTIEYKKTLPGGKDEDRREFLADVSSFANASGGDLLFGVSEKEGIPQKIAGLKADFDTEILRMENLIRDGIEPRIPNIRMKPIEISLESHVVLIRIPKSWVAPHMVVFKNLSRFFSRNSAGKYQLDIQEIRNAFLLANSLSEKVARFRDGRLAKIIANETSIPLSDDPKLVIHVLALSSFSSQFNVDVSSLKNFTAKLKPIGAGGWNNRFNLDGFVTYSMDSTNTKAFSYCQLFRSGHIESVYSEIVIERNGIKLIPSIAYEEYIVEAVRNYFEILTILEIPFPIVVFISFVGVKGAYMGYSRSYQAEPIDRDMILLPEILIEDYEKIDGINDVAKILRPAFDAFWNACGFERSFNFNEQGDWRKSR